MNSATIRKLIDLYGNFNAFRSDGKSVCLVPDSNSVTEFDIAERAWLGDIWFRREHTGIDIEPGNHDYVGFYEFPAEVQAKLDALDLIEDYAYELRQLLPAAVEMAKYYTEDITASGAPVYRNEFKVYGLKATNLRQTQRGTIILCPIEGTGISGDFHRIQGYMYSVHDRTVKFDNIQAWRMRELTREELIEFDPRWGKLVN